MPAQPIDAQMGVQDSHIHFLSVQNTGMPELSIDVHMGILDFHVILECVWVCPVWVARVHRAGILTLGLVPRKEEEGPYLEILT